LDTSAAAWQVIVWTAQVDEYHATFGPYIPGDAMSYLVVYQTLTNITFDFPQQLPNTVAFT
jgi:hypothetical protein